MQQQLVRIMFRAILCCFVKNLVRLVGEASHQIFLLQLLIGRGGACP